MRSAALKGFRPARQDEVSRIHQNLALTYALSGDWTNARRVAAQDVSASQLDARIQQWIQSRHAKRGVGPGCVADRHFTPALRDQGPALCVALVKPDTPPGPGGACAAPQGRRRRSEARSRSRPGRAVLAPCGNRCRLQVSSKRTRRFSPGPRPWRRCRNFADDDPSAGPAAGRRAASRRQTFGAGPRRRRQRPMVAPMTMSTLAAAAPEASVGLRRLHSEEEPRRFPGPVEGACRPRRALLSAARGWSPARRLSHAAGM